MSKMQIKILTAVIIIAVVIWPLYFGGNLLLALELVVALGAGVETASLYDQKRHWVASILNFAAIMTMYFVPENYFAAAASIWLVLLFAIEIFRGKVRTDSVAYTFVITVLVGLALRCMGRVYAADAAWTGWMLMLYIAAACYLCDTGAYFFGVFFGKHKMIPDISPNKTWEGSVGGYCSGLIGSLLVGYFGLKQLPFSLILCGSLVLPLVAQIGDLAFSSIKRNFKIKDFGNLLPGHGGILDRVDSLIFCLMVFNALMIIWGIAA